MLDDKIEYIKSIDGFKPETAVILGSGLGGLADEAETIAKIPYSALDGFPVSTAPAHKGELILGRLGNKDVALFNGRVHLYEGYTPQQVVMPIRLAKAIGAENVIITNASGGINKTFNTGDFMLINDHISFFIPSPLIGKNDEKLGPRFPDMSCIYDKQLRTLAKRAAVNNAIDLKEGVYAQLTGPQFESPAEIKALASLGADAVGMSTVVEAIAAKHCGLRILGISLIANLACGLLDKPLTSEEVVKAADDAAPKFKAMITEIVKNI